MNRAAALWKANSIVFISSFCVMVIELIAARILAPQIGVSLYTWTSIIAVIMAGIALGNFTGGKIADRFPSPTILALIFLAGTILTVTILPATSFAGRTQWFSDLPLMANFLVRTAFIFLLPAFVLSMVSPLVIKLTLADLGKTGGVVGTIYAVSTAGSIAGTFVTGFYLISLFGTRTIVWIIAAVLFGCGVLARFSWKMQDRWKISVRNGITLSVMVITVFTGSMMFTHRAAWQTNFTDESNYYAISVIEENNMKVLVLDRLVHSYVRPEDPSYLHYDYLKIFAGLIGYSTQGQPEFSVLHLGGGGYSLPRYLEKFYPNSVNDVVEIDPAVTRVNYEYLGLPEDTSITSYNEDARLFLMQSDTSRMYNAVVGDVFNDFSTPYHLTTFEFNQMVKEHLTPNGIYMINVIDDFQNGRFIPSLILTLKHTFNNVYLVGAWQNWQDLGMITLVIAATDKAIDITQFQNYISQSNKDLGPIYFLAGDEMERILEQREPIFLTDDHAPTDILVAPLIGRK